MQQIVNITAARQQLSQLVAAAAQQGTEVIIVRDSIPEAVLMPYSRILKQEKDKDILWSLRFDRLLARGKQAGKLWAKKNKINLKTISEDKLYDLVEKA
ncbi:MAG: type II toxin-antitoxin system Phd/YefM family antitoxin [Patescibacteria group bacterium]